MTTELPPIAFVLPWYGPDVPGGAETDARHMAERLRAAGVPVEVWTTCARHLGTDWSKNYHRPGRTEVNGVPVMRFPVLDINRDRYRAIHLRLAYGGRVTPEEEAVFFTQSIRSHALCDHIRAHPEFVCVFTPYLFGTTYWGAYVDPDRSLLIPCLHDEAFARLVALRHLFRSVRGVICNSDAEMRLVQRLHGVPDERLAVIGDGISMVERGDARAFRERYGISGPFVLYAGRKSPSKNTPLLVNYFCRYERRRETDLQLVLIGGRKVHIPTDCQHAVRDLGFVPEQDKHNAFAAATVFCQPSVHESFSIVLMEAWVQATPALVNARCDVTCEHCERGQGGLFFNGYQEFEAILDRLLADAVLRSRLGENGRRYVEQNFTWKTVVNRFQRAVRDLCPPNDPDLERIESP
jgi:glycosyltransferase involved in cell wall biosynthesis